MSELVRALEAAHGIALRARHRAFLESREHASYPGITFDGYVRGAYTLDFVTPLLADVTELGLAAGITDIEEVAWATGYVPLAALSHPDVDEPKMFLVLGPSDGAYLFLQEGFTLIELAPSLDELLARLPAVHVDHAARHVPGRAAALPGARYDEPPHLEHWNTYLEKGRAGDFAGALVALSTLHDALPTESRVLRAMASVYGDMSDLARGLAAIDRALALEPTLSNVLTKVDLLVGSGDPKSALALLAATNVDAEDDRERASHAARLAVCADLIGDAEGARAHFQRSREISRVRFFGEPWKSGYARLAASAG